VGQHANLTSVVGFVSEHVAEHLGADGTGLGPAVPVKLLDAASGRLESVRKHLLTECGALGECSTGLLRRAVCAMELWWRLQMRRCEPDPLGADVVHVGEDSSDGADVAEGLGLPHGRVKVLDEELVHALVDSEDMGCRLAGLSAELLLTRGHGSLPLSNDTSGRAGCRMTLLAMAEAEGLPRGVGGPSSVYGEV
jgi:hypothetical protein